MTSNVLKIYCTNLVSPRHLTKKIKVKFLRKRGNMS